LLALLCRESRGADAVAEVRDAGTSVAGVAEPAAVERALAGLHLDELPARAWAVVAGGPDPRLAARAAGVSLLAGRAWRRPPDGALGPGGGGPAWTDHLGWREAGRGGAQEPAAGARVAGALLLLEESGDVADPAALRADLRLLGRTPDQDWVGVETQVRALLLLG